MSYVNWDAFNKLDKKLQEGTGNADYFHAKDIEESTLVRILPPVHEEMQGVYFFIWYVFWINSKLIISNKTFGEPCWIEEEINEARESDLNEDGEIDALLEADEFTETKYAMFPMLLLEEDGDEIIVVDDSAKLMQCDKKSLMGHLRALATKKTYQRKSPDGIFDRKFGRNIELSKTGRGTKTRYSAVAWDEYTKMPLKYYKAENIPNPVAIAEKRMLPEEDQRGIIREYLYGEEYIPSADIEDDDRPKKKKKKRSTSASTRRKKPAAKKRTSTRTSTKRKTRSKPQKAASTGRTRRRRTSLLDELDEEE